jgi:hypothetical protein
MRGRISGVMASTDRFGVRIVLCGLSLLVAGCGQMPAPPSAQNASSAQAARRATPSHRPGARYDLEADERRGGHTVKRHVGETDAELRERLDRERNISAASTWTDLDAAEETVGEALQANRPRIEQWEERGPRRPNLALHYGASHVIGRSMYRGSNQAEDVTHAAIVLRADGPGFFVLTTYPEER